MPSSFLAVPLAISLSIHAAPPPEAPSTTTTSAEAPAEPEAEPAEPAAEPAVVEPETPAPESPSELAETPAEGTAVAEDPDAPILRRREPRYVFDPGELDEAAQRRATRRGTLAGLVVGMGATLGLAAPIFMLRPAKAFAVAVTDTNGVRIEPNGGALAAGLVTAFASGTLTLIGGRMLADTGVGRSLAARRQRSLHVVSGISLGLACGAFLAAVVDGGRAGAQWQEVLGREASPDDLVDGGEAADKASRALAFFAAVPPLLGFGLGLRLGNDARATVVPTASGIAVLGRF